MPFKVNQLVKATKHISGSVRQGKIYRVIKVEDPMFSRYMMAKNQPWEDRDLEYCYWLKRNEMVTCTLHSNLEPYDE